MTEMKAWARTGLILVAAMLGACAMAPGMKMAEPAALPDGKVVRITPITLDLLNRMEVERVKTVRSLAEEFSSPSRGYVIGPGDVLHITVWDHPELTIPAGSFRDETWCAIPSRQR